MLEGLGSGNKRRTEAAVLRGAGTSGGGTLVLGVEESGRGGGGWAGVEPELREVVLVAFPVMYWYQSLELKLKPVLGGRS